MLSVIIPALNEADTIGSVVRFARRDPLVGEVLVVDNGSTDETARLARAAGAAVLTGSLQGKGASMEDGLRAARHDVVLYLDGDLVGLRPDLVERLARPILDGEADFVKARFSRRAGRVTALTARPLLRSLFPELAHIHQPLGGVIAARRSLLEGLRFENDYGVDVGLLLDVAAAGARLVEVDVGHLDHDSQPLEALGEMALQVARTILDRAGRRGRLRPSRLRTAQDGELLRQADLAAVLQRAGKPERLALLDMDGVLIDGRFIVTLARQSSRAEELARLLDNAGLAAPERTRRIAALFTGVPRLSFEQAARDVPLMAGARETVLGLRQAGYRVGIVSDSYHVAAEVVRRRVFADFSVAHIVQFRGGKATGRVTLSPVMAHPRGCRQHRHCKVNVMLHLLERAGIGAEHVLAVGDGENDICLFQAAGRSVAFQPKTEAVRRAARHVARGDLVEVLAVIRGAADVAP